MRAREEFMQRFNTRVRRVCAIVLLCTIAPASHSAESQALTLSDALELISTRNPDLLALQPEAEALRQQATADALGPAMTIDAQFENFAGTGDASATRVLESTLQLSRAIELGGKAELRRRIGDTELDQLDAAQRAKRADVLAEAARRFVHVLSDQEQLEATRRATQLAQQARSVVQQRIKAGAASPVFLSRAEIALARAKIEQEHAEHELATSRVSLAVLWGESRPAFAELRGELFNFPQIESLDAYAQRLGDNPDVLRFATEARVLEARSRLAEAHRRPNITISAGVRRLEAFDDQALVAGFSIPLGTKKRAEGEVLSLAARRKQVEFSVSSHRLELQATLFALYQEILHRRTEADVLENEIRPQAEQMVQVTRQGYEAGRFSLLELADAQSQLLEIERDAIRAAAELHSQVIEIERLTGVAVHTLVTR
jgi:cobalt-zinc-cadmium efflux system outer membrane protein